METWTIRDEVELAPIARTVLASLSEGDGARVLALKGDLGAGKTSFTKVLAQELGVTEHVTSPTFVIMKSYAVPGHAPIEVMTHIDAYRIDDESELTVLGFGELLKDPHQLICLEWPERVLGLIPPHARTLSIVIGKENERIITYGD